MYFLKRHSLMIVLLIILAATNCFASHIYYMGTLTSFSNNQMVVNGTSYHLSNKIKVVFLVKDNKGAIYEKNGKLSDLKVGNEITIKVNNGEITEIESSR